MVRGLLLIAMVLAAAACNPDLPPNIPCTTNDNCPYGWGCNLTTRQCVSVPGCDNYGCFLFGSPQAPTVSQSGAAAIVTWNQGSAPGNVSGWAVLRAEAQAGPFAVVGVVGSQQNSFTDPGPLTPGKTYWYEVATSWDENVIGSPSPATPLAVPN